MSELRQIWIKRMKGGPMDAAQTARMVAGKGSAGNANPRGKRQVTIVSDRHWAGVTSPLGHTPDPRLRRANLLVSDVDFTNARGKVLKIGSVRIRINGETRNGGLNVLLSGNKWDGEGLDVETSNGGVTLGIPDGYNAELETRTVNGGLRIDFPITVQGELTSRRGISTTLGSGGPLVRVRTTNGGVKIGRR